MKVALVMEQNKGEGIVKVLCVSLLYLFVIRQKVEVNTDKEL